MSKERDILKSLLLREELELLDNLKQKLLSKQQFTKEISRVLSAAIKRAKKQDKEFERSLNGPIKRGVNKAFSENKQSIINSLLPIMGQLIRKTVTNSIKQFVADINRTLELGFSAKALKWRWQSMRSGESFADIVFHNTVHYQIVEMFVINHENGLLIQHVGSDEGEILKDNDALSAMLTALQDFIGDSVNSPDSGLASIEISDKLFLLSTGPNAYLASVIKGSPTERLKQKLQELVENIHSDYSDLITDQFQYQNNIEFTEYLQSHLVTKNISDSVKPLNWKPWLLIILLITVGLSYWTYDRNQKYQEVFNLTQSIPGFYLNDIVRNGDKFIVSGLMDPMADKSTLQSANIILDTEPFLSLDKEIIKKRVNEILKLHPNITAKISNNSITVSGEIIDIDSNLLVNKLHNVAGIDHVINHFTLDINQRIHNYIINNRNINHILNYKLKNNSFTIEGTIKENIYINFIKEFKAAFPDIVINDEKILYIETINSTIEYINNAKINLPKIYSGDINEKKKFILMTNQIQNLLKYQNQQQISIVGESDCTGTNSDDYSHARAEFIKQALIKNNIEINSLSTSIKPCVIFNTLKSDIEKNVFFIVQ